jgi:choline dehydrogenase-like flavoprotein
MISYDHVIVGSGPAGIAAALQLEKFNSCILDVGHEPASIFSNASLSQALHKGDASVILGDKWQMLDNLADPLRYHPKLRASALQHVMQGESFNVFGGYGQRLICGRGSFAAGGMANAWGAQLLKYTQEDLAEVGDWPIAVTDLSKYYTELQDRIGFSGSVDDMNFFLGEAGNLLPPVPLVPVAEYMLTKYANRFRDIDAKGLRLGRPRLAVLSKKYQSRPAHDFGEIEFFSPSGAGIYNPLDTLTELRQRGNINYLSGHKLLSYKEHADYIELEIEVLKTHELIIIRTRHLLLGCGTIQTSRLVLLKNKQFGRSLPFVDHPPTLVPIFFPAKFGSPLPKKSYPIQLIGTLEGFGKRDMMSFYYPGGMLWTDMLLNIPLPLTAARSALAALIGGMLVVQIWEESKPIPGNNLSIDNEGKVSISYPVRRPYSKLSALLASLRSLGGYSYGGLASMPPPSWGFHHAATLPMRKLPKMFETHVDGRLWDSRRVRIIDGSVLPSLPAKNHSFTIMANASRIADSVKTCGY